MVDLAIRCVDVVRSSMLAGMLRSVVEKLMDAMKSKVEKIGWSSARKIAYLAVSWGNNEALNCAFDSSFAKYIVIMHINISRL